MARSERDNLVFNGKSILKFVRISNVFGRLGEIRYGNTYKYCAVFVCIKRTFKTLQLKWGKLIMELGLHHSLKNTATVVHQHELIQSKYD